MITRARITALKDIGGAGWLSALRAPEIRALVNDGAIRQSLFDEVNFAEITHPDYEGERLVACRKPFFAAERARKREALLWATEADLEKVRTSVAAGRLNDAGKIGLRAGWVLNRHKMAKHFELLIEEGRFSFARKADAIAAEAALDGIYVIRTSVGAYALPSAEVVTTYKSQVPAQARERVLPAHEDRRRRDSPRPPSPGRPSPLQRLHLHAGGASRLSPSPCVGTAHLQRRITAHTPRPDRSSTSIAGCNHQGRSAGANRRDRAKAVPRSPRSPSHAHAQHLCGAGRRGQLRATSRTQADPAQGLRAARRLDPPADRVDSNHASQ